MTIGVRGHIGIAYAVGLCLRMIAAWSGWGWFSPDDYEFGIATAYEWLEQPHKPFGCTFRSPLVSYLMTLFMAVPYYGFQITQPDIVVRWAFTGLGILSNSIVYTGSLLVTGRQRIPVAYLLATYFLMPRIATRPMYETIAMVPLTLAIYFFQRSRESSSAAWQCSLWAALWLGIASMIRFHIGIVFGVFFGFWLWDYQQQPAHAERHHLYRRAWGLMAGALLTLCLQGAVDIALGRPVGATPWRYLQFNLRYAHTYGTSPAYIYVLHFIVYAFPPFLYWLAKPLWKACQQQTVIAVVCGVFIGVHSLIGHKEDRFMFPILPLFLVLLGLALYAWQKRHPYSRVTRLFWVTNSVCLAVATLSDGHRNITTPLLTLSRLEHAQAAVVGMASPPQFYAGKTPLLPVEDLSALHHLLKIREDVQLTHILLMQLPKDEDYKTLKQLPRHTCSAMHIYTGDFVDQWLVRLNKRNQGRAPTALLQCSFQTYSQPKSASSSTIKG